MLLWEKRGVWRPRLGCEIEYKGDRQKQLVLQKGWTGITRARKQSKDVAEKL